MSAASCIGSELMHLLPRTPTAEGRAQRTAAENMFRKLIVEYRDEMINVSSMCVMSAAVLLCDAMNVFCAASDGRDIQNAINPRSEDPNPF